MIESITSWIISILTTGETHFVAGLIIGVFGIGLVIKWYCKLGKRVFSVKRSDDANGDVSYQNRKPQDWISVDEIRKIINQAIKETVNGKIDEMAFEMKESYASIQRQHNEDREETRVSIRYLSDRIDKMGERIDRILEIRNRDE
jgi:hypothetical protein